MKLLLRTVCAKLCLLPLLRGPHTSLRGTRLTHLVCHLCEPASWKGALFARGSLLLLCCCFVTVVVVLWNLICLLALSLFITCICVIENNHLVPAVGARQEFPLTHLNPLGHLISKWQEIQRSLAGQENVSL